MILADYSFKIIILKANYSSLLFDSRYMCRQTRGVSISVLNILEIEQT